VFQLPAGANGKRVFIEFDSISMNGEVWINGHRLGKRPYAYLSHHYDLTGHLDPAGDNVLAVRVDNSLQPSSRWYTGSGIYRHVWLTQTDPLRVAHWGTQVSTPVVDEHRAVVAVATTVRNDHDAAKQVSVMQTIVDAGGKSLTATWKNADVPAGARVVLNQELEIAKPALWSPESPALYTVRTVVRDGKRVADRHDTPLGIRTVRFDPDEGLFLNGKSVIMKGMCNHHDLGPLGAALWDDALERRLRMLKEMGCNAVRTAHNPPCPELLHLCDRMGFLVINETFDEWRRGWAFENGTLVASRTNKGKARYGYNRIFDQWAERDLTDHLRRDRNHPSVIMWSIGNEVPEAQKHGEVETVKWLRELCRKLDPTRPVTLGCNFMAGANETGFPEFLDVVGYNGGGGSCFQYEADHTRFPERRIYASEVPHSFQTRGEYRTRSRYREPKHQPPHLTEEELFPETDGYYESSYDNAGVRISARDSWRLTKTLPFVAGEFRWTGFDYLGESGGWPRVIGNFGIIDICNFPKDTYFFYQSQWAGTPVAHLLPHWSWPGREGVPIPVWCYTNAERVELFLNGESLGHRGFTKENDMHLEWLVPYAPGELKAVASRDGEVVATSIRRTAGAPARIALDADRTGLERGGRKLSYVTVRIEDADGNVAPKAANWVKFSVSGPGRLLAVGNGDPLSHESFQSTTVRTFNGLALAIIASDPEAVARHESRNMNKETNPNEIVVKATSKGLETAEVLITAAPRP
jgi:beta-galactosidase